MNILCSNVKNIVEIPFPIVVGSYSCASKLDAQNLVKRFERKINLLDCEVLKTQYDLANFVKDHLKLGYIYKHVLEIENFCFGCLDKFQTRERF